MPPEAPSESLAAADRPGLVSLAAARRGFSGVIERVAPGPAGPDDLPAIELERRLLEMGFVEGARVRLLHEGPFGRDPICIRLDDMRVALRRRDARGVLVRAETAP